MDTTNLFKEIEARHPLLTIRDIGFIYDLSMWANRKITSHRLKMITNVIKFKREQDERFGITQ